MSSGISGIGTLKYDGLDLNGPFVKTTEASVKPNWSQDGRTVVSATYKLTIETYIGFTAGTTTDATLENLREKLTSPGRRLIYIGRGFGDDLTVDTGIGTHTSDLRFGPRPVLLTWEPQNNITAKITWSVEFTISRCGASIHPLSLYDISTSLTWTEDEFGLTTREYSCTAKIPGVRARTGSQRMLATADQLLERLIPELPIGFRREHQVRNISPDKTTIQVTVTDTELPGYALPPGVIHADADHDVASQPGAGTMMWTSTLSASYQLVKTMPRAKAYEYFLTLLKDRIAKTKRFSGIPGMRTGGARKLTVLIASMKLREGDLYGRGSMSFVATWAIAASLQNILQASGLFTPVPGGTDYQRWKVSLADTAHHARGLARHRLLPSDDAIISICDGTTSVLKSGGFTTGLRSVPKLPFDNEYPPADQSYLKYDVTVFTEPVDGTVSLRTLPEKPIEARMRTGAFDLGKGLENGGAAAAELRNNLGGFPQMYKPPREEPNIIQQRTYPQVYITLAGRIVRAGYPIAPPVLEKVGNLDAVPCNRDGNGFATRIVANWGGVPIVGAAFRLTWALPNVPAGFLGAVGSPVLGP